MSYLNPHPDENTIYSCTACESSRLWDREDIYVSCHDCGHRMVEPDEREPRADPPTDDPDDLPANTNPETRQKLKRLRAAREDDG